MVEQIIKAYMMKNRKMYENIDYKYFAYFDSVDFDQLSHIEKECIANLFKNNKLYTSQNPILLLCLALWFEKNLDKKLYYLKQAVENGSRTAPRLLGEHFESIDNIDEARQLYLIGIDRNDYMSAKNMALTFYYNESEFIHYVHFYVLYENMLDKKMNN